MTGVQTCALPILLGSNTSIADRIEVPILAGELICKQLRQLSLWAESHAEGYLLVSANQNLAFYPGSDQAAQELRQLLTGTGFLGEKIWQRVPMRVCPGNHECRMGLAATRDVAAQLLATLGPAGQALDWAVSGCFNSCAQPQLAAAGVQAVANRPDADGRRRPLFDFYRRTGTGLGQQVARNLSLEQLLQLTAALG